MTESSDYVQKKRKCVIKSWATTYYIHISAPICRQRTGRRTCIPTWCRQPRTWINDRESFNHRIIHCAITKCLLHPDLLGEHRRSEDSSPVSLSLCAGHTERRVVQPLDVFCNNPSAPCSSAVNIKLGEQSLKDKTIGDVSHRRVLLRTLRPDF